MATFLHLFQRPIGIVSLAAIILCLPSRPVLANSNEKGSPPTHETLDCIIEHILRSPAGTKYITDLMMRSAAPTQEQKFQLRLVLGKRTTLFTTGKVASNERILWMSENSNIREAWTPNLQLLEDEIIEGRPIRDAEGADSVTHALRNDSSILRRERNVLYRYGYVFDPATSLWTRHPAIDRTDILRAWADDSSAGVVNPTQLDSREVHPILRKLMNSY